MKVNVPDQNLPRIVIIGGGFGGLRLARKLRNAPVQVVMFDRNNYHTFQPLLYQVATAGLEPDSIAFPLRKLFKKQKNFFFRMAEVKAVEADKRRLHTSIGELEYDYLVVATGSRTNYFGLDQIEAHSYGMKDIVEALNLRHLMLQSFEQALLINDIEEREALMNFVIVGGGPTGVEMAGALAELKRHVLPKDYPELDFRRMQIHLVESHERVLSGMHPKSSQNAEKALKKLGVNLWLNSHVEAYDGRCVQIKNGKQIQARTVIWAAGVKGNLVGGLEDFKQERNRLEVDKFNRVKGQERIFAIGDASLMRTEDYPNGHPQVAPAAIQQAENLAVNIKSIFSGKKLREFSYKDKGSMATIGRNKAVVDLKKLHFKGWFAWLAWMVVHLFSLAGFRNKLIVFANWFWNYVTFDRGTRLIIRKVRPKSENSKDAEDVPEDETKKTDPHAEVLG